ncbi:MAG TPA: hypothetical protein VNY52_06205 [Solirubrobacteraceae bacterium]|jgi:hypothetical protein|nr:hypothetical protein [Solirubrobacteraceae bacterium]
MKGSGTDNAGDGAVRQRGHRRGLASASLAIVVVLTSTVAYEPVSHALVPTALVQEGSKLPAGEDGGKGYFGRAVALSADGDTALIGAPHDDGEAGAALVLTRSGSTWTQQAQLISGEAGVSHFGHSVALSADGETAVIGAPTFDDRSGAAWVFTRSGSTWTLQAKLTGAGESGAGRFGAGVALSADGETALVGAPADGGDLGAAWVFTRAGSTWTPQGEKLTGGGESGAGRFGAGVALSADGETALVGAPADGGDLGAAWVFARSGSTWTPQGEKLTGGEESGAADLGESVALSADGATALVGGRNDDGKAGAAWLFERSGSTWAQRGAKLAANGEVGTGEFGWSVALSADGETALIGGRRDEGYAGAAWLFSRSGSTWAQQGEKLTGGEEAGKSWFGSSVALAADGATALIGGIGDDGRAGAAWVFGLGSAAPAPPLGGGTSTATQTSPPAGSATPGTSSPSAQGGVEAFKAVGGAVVLVSRSLSVRSGRATVRLRCAAPVACRGRLVLTIAPRARAARRAKAIAIAGAPFSISRERTATTGLRLSAVGRTDLNAARGGLYASLAIHVAVPQPSSARTYVVKLVRPRPHHAGPRLTLVNRG